MTETDLDPAVEFVANYRTSEVSDAPESASDHPSGTPLVPLWKKLTAAASWVIAAFFLFVVVANGRTPAPENVIAGAALVPQSEQTAAPDGTLGIRFAELRDAWNSVEHPPQISTPLRRTPEGGELDSFYHRFDPGAELIGAYRDSDDYLVALLVRANIAHGAISTMYLHLCQMINPFSPDCLDNYFSVGLAGLDLSELSASGSDNTWTYEGNEWRVTVTDDQLTIRVVSPSADS